MNQLWHVSRVHSLFFATRTTVAIKQGVCQFVIFSDMNNPTNQIWKLFVFLVVVAYVMTIPRFLLVWGSLRLTPIMMMQYLINILWVPHITAIYITSS